VARARRVSGPAARAVLAGLLVAVAAPGVLSAQAAPQIKVQPEVRLDAIVSDRRSSLQAGAGAEIPVGYYARIGVIGGMGAQTGGDARGAFGRVDVLGRFLFDPFRQSAVGLSAGGGVSLRAERGEPVRPFLVAAVDIEGRRSSGGISPALQLGLGGGVRIGAVLRWGAARAR
jgi:hypothetical protein